MDMSKINAIGIDEIQWQRVYKYLTHVYQIDTISNDCSGKEVFYDK